MVFRRWHLVEIQHTGTQPFAVVYQELAEAFKKVRGQAQIGSIRLARYPGMARMAATDADDSEFQDFVASFAGELSDLDAWTFKGVNWKGEGWQFPLA